MHKYLLFYCLLTSRLMSQDYNCNFLTIINKGIKEQVDKYNIYLLIKDSVKIVRSKNNQYKVVSKFKFNAKRIDSLILKCNYKYIFDDPLFISNNEVIFIDTFNFFKDMCIKENTYILNKSIHKDRNQVRSNNIDTIVLRSIKSYRNNLVIALKHSRSKYEVHFYFNLVANLPPKLEKIIREEEYIE